MTCHSYSQLVRYKQWADRGLYDVVGQNFNRLNAQDAAIMLRILDHIHVVDKIFQSLAGIAARFPSTAVRGTPGLPGARGQREGNRRLVHVLCGLLIGRTPRLSTEGRVGMLARRHSLQPGPDLASKKMAVPE